MGRPVVVRYVILVFTILISLHFLLSFTHAGYSNTIRNLAGSSYKSPNEGPTYVNAPSNTSDPDFDQALRADRANATFVILARNSDTDNTVRSIRDIEDRFNKQYGYPYVFLNEEPFSEDFKARVSNVISSTAEFGVIPHDHWFQPDWIDEPKAAAARQALEDDHVIYGGSVSYRNMCRFNSGFFFRHPLLLKYKWYWRIEPDVHFHCDIAYDPFMYLQKHDKVYGFTITMYEFIKTIPSLWDHVLSFMNENPQYIAGDNAMDYMSDDGGKTYNKCHFWSNFEIADMDFWRSDAYMDFFNYLDKTGGFYYERWGDAPVHSIAAALFLQKDQIHFFNDIGYEHNPYTHCPQGDQWALGKCACDQGRSFDYDGYSCMRQWDRLMGR